MGASQGWAMVTAGPVFDGQALDLIRVVGVLTVAFLTSVAVVVALLVTHWFLRRRARSAEAQAADGAEEGGGAAVGTIADGVIIGLGLLLGLLVARWWWMAVA